MAKEYISREAANKWICETCDGCEGTFCAPCDGNPLKDIPAADVVEVRHGRWNGGAIGWECSVCTIESNNTYPHCPYCGAVMDGGQDDV